MLFNVSKEDLAKSKKRFYVVGGVMLAIGVLSLAMPMLASFAVETVIGCLLLAVGLCQAVSAYRGFADGDKPWTQILMAALSFLSGFVFLANPIAGVITLSMFLACYFLVYGITKVFEYFRMRAIGGSVWILVSGLLDVILFFLMWRNFFTGASVIGVILGVNLIFSGVAFITLGRGCSEAMKQ
ncbi:MAG: DUF308 domain-containing protein [Synergistaceae bacterium]|nr:DUF308 domain-containing protein [Synergistaceae bacterium]